MSSAVETLPKYNVITYIDGFNLYFGIRREAIKRGSLAEPDATWYRYMWLDLHAMCSRMLNIRQQLVAVKYFTAPIIGRKGKQERQNAYLDALRTLPKVEIIFGRFEPDRKECDKCGHPAYFVVSPDGGSPRRLTTEPFENNVPTWSRDGNWVYFSSNRAGNWQIWKVPAAGGRAAQVTKAGGFSAQESPDGKLLYSWVDGGTIWKMPTEGGDAVRVLDGVQSWDWWRISAKGIFFLDASNTPALIKFFDFATGKSQQITSVDLGYKVPGPRNFDFSPNGRWIIFKRVDEVDCDVMLVENFR